MPSVQRAYEIYKDDKNVLVVMVSVDGSRAPVDTYLAENGYTMPVMLDDKIEVASKFGVLGTPSTFIINRQEKIVASGYGPLDFDHAEFRKYLKSLIAEPVEQVRR